MLSLRCCCSRLPLTPETPEKRVALVIGIGTYQEVPVLANPPNDARSIGEALQGLDFDVAVLLNSDKRGLEAALRDFSEKASEADVALIYFAGHGLQVDGRNFLVPADARLKRAQATRYDAIELNDFLDAVAEARKVGIMIVDACRNNPFVDRLSAQSGSSVKIRQGMSSIQDTPSGVLVAMATRADSVASDGAGQHSPYTDALLKELAQPGVELGLFFRAVSDLVKQATNNRQEPYFAGTIGATPIYLNPKPVNSDPVVAVVPPVEVLDTAGATPLAIPAPTDPDVGDHLVVQIVGLPKGGQVRMSDRILIISDPLTVDQLKLVNFVPDRSFTGDAGAFQYVVRDDRGGSASGKVDIKILPGNHSRGRGGWRNSQGRAQPPRYFAADGSGWRPHDHNRDVGADRGRGAGWPHGARRRRQARCRGARALDVRSRRRAGGGRRKIRHQGRRQVRWGHRERHQHRDRRPGRGRRDIGKTTAGGASSTLPAAKPALELADVPPPAAAPARTIPAEIAPRCGGGCPG